MPYTRHGWWYGERHNGDTDHSIPPPPRVDCGGPHRCLDCAADAHRGQEEIGASQDDISSPQNND